jgi:transcriptional regulator with XRE-family HTH domain
MNVKSLRASTGMTQKEFATYFEIPIRTLQDWEAGKRTPPSYVVSLIKYKIEKESLKMMKLIEMTEGLRKELVEGNLQDIINWLKNNKSVYEWQLDEDPEATMPDLSEVETLLELESELEKVNLGWWTLSIEKGEEKVFKSMADLGYHEEEPWYQMYDGQVWRHTDRNFYGIYGNEVDGWELAYWGEDMDEPWVSNMYYDEECNTPVDIDMIEK